MSVHVISWVLRHSEATGSDRLVLIVLADHADGDGTNAYPAVETIAAEARVSRRTVQSALRQLEHDARIAREPVKGPRGVHRYTVHMAEGADSAPPAEGADHDAQGRNPRREGAQSQRPNRPEPTTEPSTGAREAQPSFAHDVDERLAPWREVIEVVQGVARHKSTTVTPWQVVEECERFANRAHSVEAERFAFYWIEGGGMNRPTSNVRQAWRNWLQRAPDGAHYTRRRRGKRSDGPSSDDLRRAAEAARAAGR